MAKKRYINTKFWSDDFIINLKPLERYFFLYLLTNEHTDICGIYELSLKVIERETELDEKTILKMFSLLKTKIAYTDGWIYIKNFEKHQAVNPKVEEGIKRSKSLIPSEILAKLSDNNIDYDSLSKSTIEPELLTPTLSPKPILKPLLNTSEQSSQEVKKIEPIDLELSQYLLSKIKNNLPTFKEPSNLNKWANACRLMREQDKRTPDQIRFIIEFAQQDDFWKSNILSMDKLRKQFDQLTAKAKSFITSSQIISC